MEEKRIVIEDDQLPNKTAIILSSSSKNTMLSHSFISDSIFPMGSD